MRSTLVVVAVLAFLSGDAMCSQMSFQTLDEAITPETIVLRATLTSVERKDASDTLRTHYTFTGVTILRGAPGVALESGTYSQRVPVMRNEKGAIVGSASLRLRASGAENQVKKGDQVFLFVESVGPDGDVDVVRIELLENEPDVTELIANQAPVKRK